jgi:hypothetical protein
MEINFVQYMLNMWKSPSTMLLAMVSAALMGIAISLVGSANTTVQGQLGLNPVPTTEEVIPQTSAEIFELEFGPNRCNVS